MIAGIHQAENLPWLGYFYKIFLSDCFVILDEVQFKKNYFENRNRIHTKQGLKYVTIPVGMKGHTQKKFCEIEIVDRWKKKYIATLEHNYKRAPFYRDLIDLIELLRIIETRYLFDINIELIKKINSLLEIDTKIILSSEIGVNGKKTELLILILKSIGAKKYIVGKSGLDYMNLELFKKNNIKLLSYAVNVPNYQPFNYKEYICHPSIIDTIANIGLKKTKDFIRKQASVSAVI